MQCVFCEIVKKKIPAKIVYEDAVSVAFLDINPINPGHTLVIPKEHSETILDINPDILSSLMKTVKIASEALTKALSVDGINIIQNNKEIAGQIVPHLHFHLIPRFKDDGITSFFEFHRKKMEEENLEEVANKIKNNIKLPKPEKVEEKVEEETIEHAEEEAYLIRREIELA